MRSVQVDTGMSSEHMSVDFNELLLDQPVL